MDKYNYLIEMGKELPLIDPALRNDNYLIRGCQSRVWINADLKDGKYSIRPILMPSSQKDWQH
jgi:cysteine desulfuration protein SufE